MGGLYPLTRVDVSAQLKMRWTFEISVNLEYMINVIRGILNLLEQLVLTLATVSYCMLVLTFGIDS